MQGIAATAKNMSDGDLYFGAELMKTVEAVEPEAFRELAFYALRRTVPDQVVAVTGNNLGNDLMSPGLAEQSASWDGKMVAKLEPLEQEVRALLNSRSWKLTKPLRDLRKRASFEKYSNLEMNANKEESELDEYGYYTYLVTIKASILKSHSWSLTSIFRKWNML